MATPLPTSITAALSAAEAALSSLLNPTSTPGVAFSVYYQREPVHWAGLGVADKATGRAPNHTDVFRIASNTKVFTSLLAVLFVELGFIRSLDDPVSQYAPTFAAGGNTFGDGALITFKQLMSHTSGLPDSLPGNADWTNVTTAAVFTALARVPLMVPPGTLPFYSNLGISVLGHILAEFVAPADERGDIGPLLEKYIFAPLGLSGDTGYALTPAAVARLCPAYDGVGARVPVEDIGWTAPCGTMWSTPAGVAAFHSATATVASGTRIPGFALSPAAARMWLQPVSLTADNSIIMGQPWQTFVLDSGFVVRSKSGTLSGFSTMSAVIPELRLSFAYTFNGNYGWYAGNDLLKNVTNALAPAFAGVITGLLPPRSGGPTPSDYVGTYTQAHQPCQHCRRGGGWTRAAHAAQLRDVRDGRGRAGGGGAGAARRLSRLPGRHHRHV